jgi:hypothetical protein
MTISLVFIMLFGMAFACADDETNVTNTQTIPAGRYWFMSITTFRADGSPQVNIDLTGGLTLHDNGRYEHDLWMSGTPFGYGPGSYRISGNKLYLNPDPAVNRPNIVYNFIYDQQKNRLSLSQDEPRVLQLLCGAGKKDC